MVGQQRRSQTKGLGFHPGFFRPLQKIGPILVPRKIGWRSIPGAMK
jgi:hypothetical protein